MPKARAAVFPLQCRVEVMLRIERTFRTAPTTGAVDITASPATSASHSATSAASTHRRGSIANQFRWTLVVFT